MVTSKESATNPPVQNQDEKPRGSQASIKSSSQDDLGKTTSLSSAFDFKDHELLPLSTEQMEEQSQLKIAKKMQKVLEQVSLKE